MPNQRMVDTNGQAAAWSEGSMPKDDYYRGLKLGDAVRKLAEHHRETKNRHISEDEYQLLIRAAKALGAEQLQGAGAAGRETG